MRKRLVAATAGLLLASCAVETTDERGESEEAVATGEAHLVAAPKGRAVPGEYIVVLKEEAAGSRRARSVAAIAGVAPLDLYESALDGFSATLTQGQLLALRRNPAVDYVEEVQRVTTNGVQSAPPWALDRIDQRSLPLSSSYGYVANGSGVNAYVIDTGIDVSHPNFGGRARTVKNFFPGQGAACDDHGTHVAGIVGSATYGVAKNVQLRSVKVFRRGEYGECFAYSRDVIAAIDWVKANAVKPAVVNLSLGGGKSPAEDRALTALVQSGVFAAVAAGNDGYDPNNPEIGNACLNSPTSPLAMVVGASDSADRRYRVTDAFEPSFELEGSSWGPCLDVYAPGVRVLSTKLGGGSVAYTGTSMAAPQVAGVAALYLSKHRSATPAATKAWIESNATAGKIKNNPPRTANKLLFKPAAF